jgi:predicted AlkP superfamily pyrophosphatase or phosphodiesterase
MKEKLGELDQNLGYMLDKLKENKLFDNLNILITSDHGMAQFTKNTTIFLDSYLNTELFDAYGSRAVYSIFVRNSNDLDYVYNTLKTIPNVDVYKKDELLDSFHYKNNVRIGQIVIVAHLGYVIYINNQTIDYSVNSKLNKELT